MIGQKVSYLEVISEANELFLIASKLSISNGGELKNSGELLKKIKGLSHFLDENRKSKTKPLDEAKRELMAEYSVPLKSLKDAECILKKAIAEYMTNQESKQREDDSIAFLEAKKNTPNAPAVFISPEENKVPGISKKTTWKFRITDESKIPREYLIPDERGLADIAKKTKGKLDIPGIEFYPDTTISARKSL